MLKYICCTYPRLFILRSGVVLRSGSEEHVDTLHNVILLGIVGMFLTGNLQDGWNGMMVILQDVPNIIGNVLVDKNDTDIISSGKILKGLLDLLEFRVRLDNQKVRALCSSVADACQQETRDRVLWLRSRSEQPVSSMRRIPTKSDGEKRKEKISSHNVKLLAKWKLGEPIAKSCQGS
jgi:hypothetical protein